MPEDPKLRFSIYKIDDVDRCREKIRSKGYRPVSLDDSRVGWELYLSGARTKPPKWISVLAEIVNEAGALGGLRDVTYSFVLVIPEQGNYYAVCGGLGSFVVQSCIEQDFGLDIVSRVVSPDKIKYKRSKNFAGRAAQEETLYKEYYNYEFDTSNWIKVTKEILGEIQDADLSEFFGLASESRHKIRLDGKNSLSINRAISVDDLATLIRQLFNIENNVEHKFKILKGFSQVGDKITVDALDQVLTDSLRSEYLSYLADPESYQETSIGISYSDMKEFLLCDSFELKLGRADGTLDEGIDLNAVFEFLHDAGKDEFRTSYLRNILVIGSDQDGRPRIEGALRNFLYAEVRRLESTYFLIDSKWFFVNQSFQEEVNARFAEAISSSLPFTMPPWEVHGTRLETEDEYVDAVCAEDDFHKLHRNHIIIHGSDKSEICDIVDLRTDTAFVFVKKGLGSKFRELLAQARSSAELYTRDNNFRDSSISKITEVVGDEPGFIKIPKEISWILAFTDHSLNRAGQPLSARLTTVVKTDVVHTFEFLRELGLPKIGFCEIDHTT